MRVTFLNSVARRKTSLLLDRDQELVWKHPRSWRWRVTASDGWLARRRQAIEILYAAWAEMTCSKQFTQTPRVALALILLREMEIDHDSQFTS